MTTSKNLRIVFAGTPEFAAEHLSTLLDSNFNVVACYTQPDRPAGRGKKLQPSEVKKLAQSHNIPVCQPPSFKDQQALNELEQWQADIMIVVAYGLLLPEPVLQLPKLGCINVHGSILPKWRGAAPIQRAVLAGDKETGVTIMQMDKGLDTGDILHIERCQLSEEETSGSLYQKLQSIGPQALVNTLDKIANQNIIATPQDNSLATYAHKLNKQESLINWVDSAEEIERKIRGYQPWPVAHANFQDNIVKIWQAEVIYTENNTAPGTIIEVNKSGITIATSSNAIKITELQPAGKKSMKIVDFLNGRSDWVKLGSNLLLIANAEESHG